MTKWRRWKLEETKINIEHVTNSLANRIAELAKENALKDATIIELSKKVKELEQDNEELRKSIVKKEKNDK